MPGSTGKRPADRDVRSDYPSSHQSAVCTNKCLLVLEIAKRPAGSLKKDFYTVCFQVPDIEKSVRQFLS